MCRKKRHKIVVPILFGLILTLLVIYGFKGDFFAITPPSLPSFTRRELLTVQKADISTTLHSSQMISPWISPVLGDTQNAPHGSIGLAPVPPPSTHSISPAEQNQAHTSPSTRYDKRISPSNQIMPPVQPPISQVAPPPLVVQSPSLPISPPLAAPPPISSTSPLSSPVKDPPPIHWTSPVSSNSNVTAVPPVSSPPRNLSTHSSSPSNIATSPPPSPFISSSPPVQNPSPKVPPAKELPAPLSSPNSSRIHVVPVASPPVETTVNSSNKAPVPSPPKYISSHLSPASSNTHNNGHTISPVPSSPVNHRNRGLGPVAPPPKEETSPHFSHRNISNKDRGPVISPAPQKAKNASRPINPSSSSPAPSRALIPKNRNKHNHRASPPFNHGPSILPSPVHPPNGEEITLSPSSSPSPSPVHSSTGGEITPHTSPSSSPSPSPSPVHSSTGGEITPQTSPSPSPSPSQASSFTHHKHKRPALVPAPTPLQPETIRSLPPPPPNLYCTPLYCSDPYTNSPAGPGSPCTCVLPIKIGLRLSVSLYTFFNLVSSLAQELASGVKMKQSQVRVMGANSATQDSDKTDVLIDLVPLGERFDNVTALLIFEKFWYKEVIINPNYFGDYEVLYVLYPGLPPSPPVGTGSKNGDGNGRSEHPLAADVSKNRERQKGSIIAIIILSSIFALVLCAGATWFLILKLRRRTFHNAPSSRIPITPPSKPSIVGTRGPFLASKPSSITASFNSYKGSAKTFTLAEMQEATNNFHESKLIGEGGFGRVYAGVLGEAKQQQIAVKVLKRDDQREFFAEVEMLSRLHHRNLVKLIGICTEESSRCLVYELVPNGSVESHLYGSGDEVALLDWNARLKIALGAARALAYLHEDSSPRVIHRDFKLSNILLEHDFTPKVSDFGLAKSALGEDDDHISTRVMGTFGYVAPEYAMTGHLLVKSDVYSYGVVLLELLTGRKPVDMLRPAGQENLVTWALPLLTNQQGLESIVDKSLGTVPFASLAKVAAIASMCVQPEVDQRPFMGEVVQALKLVYNEGNDCDCNKDEESESEESGSSTSFDMGLFGATSASPRFERDGSGSFRRDLGSGPLRMGREGRDWERGNSSRFGMDSKGSESYL